MRTGHFLRLGALSLVHGIAWGALAAPPAVPDSELWFSKITREQDCAGHERVVVPSDQPGAKYRMLRDLEGRQFEFPLSRESAFAILLNTCEFANDAVGYDASPSNQVYAINVLWDQPDALPAFEDLARRANTAGRLYALCGLMDSTSPALKPLLEELRATSESVMANQGCIFAPRPAVELVGDILSLEYPKRFRDAYGRAKSEDVSAPSAP